MKVKKESLDNVGIFFLSGDIAAEHEDNLKLLLMKAVHAENRSVINLREVTGINHNCRKLLNKAYCTSKRLNNPLIMTEIPRNYMSEILSCASPNNETVISGLGKDSGKDSVLNEII